MLDNFRDIFVNPTLIVTNYKKKINAMWDANFTNYQRFLLKSKNKIQWDEECEFQQGKKF